MSTRPRTCVAFPPCRAVSDHLARAAFAPLLAYALPCCRRYVTSPASASFAHFFPLVWRVLALSPLATPARCIQTGGTPIYVAAQKGHLDVVTFLSSHGADVNAATTVRCVSFVACFMPSPSSASFARCWLRALLTGLARIGPSPITTPSRCVQYGGTPIYIAAHEGHLDVVTTLTDHGADRNVPTTVRCVSFVASRLGVCVTLSARLAPCRAVSSVCRCRRPLRSRAAG